MPTKCNLGSHGPCTACERYCTPNTLHHHVFDTRSGHEILCKDCALTTVYAATIILEAIRDAGIEATHEELRKLLIDRRIVVLVQSQLPKV